MSDRTQDHAAAIRRAANEAEARANEAERKVELSEWMAYQRRRNPGISNEEILRLTYVPEWRDLDAPGEAEARCQRKDAYIARITARLDAVRRALEDAPGDTAGCAAVQFDWAAYRDGLEGEPEWESAEDLARLSIESFIADKTGERER